MDNGSERELVRRMLGGDQGAFDEFFADYFPRLFRFALLRLRDPDAAEDIVQTSLIAAMRHIGSWRGEASLFTWLCTICRREITAWQKRTSRRVFVSIEDDDRPRTSPVNTLRPSPPQQPVLRSCQPRRGC